MSQYVNEANESNFNQIIKNGNVVIDFWAPWCGPCRQLGPVLDEVAMDLKDQVKVYKINVDENPELAKDMGIRGIPTVVMFKNGEPCFSHSGAYPKEFWMENINKNL